ncbi:hypothetical protein EOM86_11880 [Candidatus Nomurabacteria bacterium]|nr:hypothetical protein [Candidatus Nomurabacteria bacterium]
MSIRTNLLQDFCVTYEKLAADVLNYDNFYGTLPPDFVGSLQIKDNAITPDKLAPDFLAAPVFGDIVADTLTVTKNIKTGTGTLCPTIMMSWDYEDIDVGNNHLVNREPGNLSADHITFKGGFITTNASGETMSWRNARLIFRGNSVKFGDTYTVMKIIATKGSTSFEISSQFTVYSPSQIYGYGTHISPWFALPDTTGYALRIEVVSATDNAKFRFGPSYIQFVA